MKLSNFSYSYGKRNILKNDKNSIFIQKYINYKNLCKIFFLYSLLFLLCLMLTISFFIYQDDKYQILKPNTPYNTNKFDGNMRLEALAIINKCSFDSVILGTSMLENTSALEASEKLKENYINISLSGSNFYERSIILNYLLKNKNIKSIVYSMDSAYLNCQKYTNVYPLDAWTFLYDENKINDIKIYRTFEYLRLSFKNFIIKILNKDNNPKINIKNLLDRPNAWYKYPHHAGRFGGMDNWVKNWQQQGVKEFIQKDLPNAVFQSKNKIFEEIHDEKKELMAKQYIDEYILKYVKLYARTNFYLLFPPYFRYRYAEMIQKENPSDFYLHQYIIRYLTKISSDCKNLFVFGFEDCDFLEDISRYKDTSHYDKEINTFMTDCIASKEYLLTMENIDSYLKHCTKLAFEYDLEKLNEKFQKAVKRIHKGE